MSSRDGCQRALLGKRKSELGVLRPGSGPSEDTGAFSFGWSAMRKSEGKHSNSNWKQTGASGTMPLHSASLSCLHAAAREGGFGRHGAESKPRDEYVPTLLQREKHDQKEFAVIIQCTSCKGMWLASVAGCGAEGRRRISCQHFLRLIYLQLIFCPGRWSLNNLSTFSLIRPLADLYPGGHHVFKPATSSRPNSLLSVLGVLSSYRSHARVLILADLYLSGYFAFQYRADSRW